MPFSPRIARWLARTFGGNAPSERVERLHFPDLGHGYDRFGLQPDFVALGDVIGRFAYDRYFRVESQGHQHLPRTGPAILASNHSGALPFDGAMIWVDVFRHTEPPRVPRPVADYFVTSLPVVSTFYARTGVVGGSRGNARALLEAGELLMVFPEGTAGISKHFSQRYRLQQWTKGHAELAILHQAPVVPVAVVGAEEQMPQIGRIPIKVGALPFIPIMATPVPLPVKYHIRYGEPLRFDQEFAPKDADDPEIVAAAAARVKDAVQALLKEGLASRTGVFT